MSDPSRPEQPERPRYGEYAPGYTPPAPSAAPSAPAPPAPDAPAWAAPARPQDGAPSYGAQQWTPAPAGRPRRMWDLVLTIILLVLAVFGTLFALVYGAILTNPSALDQAFRQQGLGGFSGQVGSAPAIIVVSHLVLFLLAVVLSVIGLIKRWVTFWIPLSIGVVAAIVFWATLLSVVMTDPGFLQRYGG